MGRILMVVRPSRGGAFGHCARLACALTARGHEVAICGPHAHWRGRLDAEIIDVEIAKRPSPGRDLAAVASLGKVYRSYDPDLIHAHGSKGGTFARLARAARPRVPLVFTPHNYAFTNWFAGGAQRGAYRAIETVLAPLATRVVCVCEAERRIACSIGPSSRTRVVYNGIDTFAAIHPNAEAEALSRSGPLVVTCSELQPPKGVITLVESMPAILERAPTATLVVAGEGYLRPGIEARIAELGIEERVRLLGSLDDVTGLLDAASVYVQPGWSESFPYAVLEAMSLGLPIVATDVGGVGEAIEDGVTGRLAAAQDAAGLGAAVLDLLERPDRARELGAAARSRQRERFSFEGMVGGTLAVYRELGLR